MSISARSITFLANYRPSRPARLVFAAALFAAAAAPGTATAGPARAGAYDGTWNVTFIPQAGNCHASNSVPFAVAGQRVTSAGGGKVTGGVSRNGSVAVRVTVGASWANGSGRLAGNAGTGRWSGVLTGDRCSGSWQAIRS